MFAAENTQYYTKNTVFPMVRQTVFFVCLLMFHKSLQNQVDWSTFEGYTMGEH